MKLLLIVMAVVEAIAGIALFIFPKVTVSEVLNTPLDTPGGVLVGRLAGAALIALGICCWQAISSGGLGVVRAMLFYNAAAAAVLVYGGLRLGLASIFIWPMVVLHCALAAGCAFILWLSMRKQLAESSTASG